MDFDQSACICSIDNFQGVVKPLRPANLNHTMDMFVGQVLPPNVTVGTIFNHSSYRRAILLTDFLGIGGPLTRLEVFLKKLMTIILFSVSLPFGDMQQLLTIQAYDLMAPTINDDLEGTTRTSLELKAREHAASLALIHVRNTI